MKKIIGIVVAVVVLAAVAFGFIFLKPGKKTYAIENLLPAKPAFYLRLSQLTQRMDNFSKTKLYQDLKSIDYKKATAAFGAPFPKETNRPDALVQVEDAWGKAFSDENVKMFKALFGDDVAVAVYASDLKDVKTLEKKTAQEIFENVFVVTRLSPEIAAAETVLKFLGQFNKDLKIETERYNGQDINLLKSADGKFLLGYVRFNDLVVMGLGQKAARTAIDIIAKKQPALSTDEDYTKRVKTSYEGAQTFGYFNIKTFYPMLTEEISQLAKSEQESALYKAQLEEQLKQIQGLDALVFSSKPGNIVTFKADLLYDLTAVSPEMKSYYACRPQDNLSAKFVPWDALTYQWNSCLDFSQIWTQYKTQVQMQGNALGQDIDVNKMVGTYEQMVGVSVERDVLPVLGKEFGLYLTDVDLTTAIPLPKIVLFIQTTGREGADALINKLLALQPNLQFEETKYADDTIRYIPIPIAEGLALSTTYIGNTLLVATNVDILKSSLDAIKDPSKSIGISPAIQANDGPKNSVFFLQVDRLLQKAAALLDWVGQAAKQNQIQRQAFLTGSQKNLNDIRARNEQLKTEIANKQKRISELSAAPIDPVADPVAQIDALKKEVDVSQNELTANQEKEKNLSQQIAFYENKAPKPADNQKAIDEFVKPVLKGLENIKYLNVTTVNGDGVLGSTIEIKIE